jgi:hypothetical protein
VAIDDSSKSATYEDPNAPHVVTTYSAAPVTYASTPAYSAPANAGWNPFYEMQKQSFDSVTCQLNALNSYSAAPTPPTLTMQPMAADAGLTEVFNNFWRIAALIVMWIASLCLLFRKRAAKA